MIKSQIILFFSFFLISCNEYNQQHQVEKLNFEEITLLKQKYDRETFNYFYETVFYSDRTHKKLNKLSKWDKDIKIIILGHPEKEEEEALNNIIQLINQQGLAIKLSRVNKVKEANFKVYFGEKKDLDSIFILNETTNGIARITSTHGRIKQVEIGVIRNENTKHYKRKKAVLLEEIIQSLGVNGDSFSYPNSIFYEAENFQDDLITIDKQVLSLLYNQLLPFNYPRSDFEKDFADVLYSVNTNDKVKEYIQKYNISRDILEKIKNTCFVDNVFYKHPKNIDIYMVGKYTSKDSLQVLKTISALNELSEQINIELKSLSVFRPEAGIQLNFKKNQDQEYTVMSTIYTNKGIAMFPKRISNEVFISYKNDQDTERKKNRNIVKVIYKCLGPLEMTDFEGLFTEKNDTISFGIEFQEIIRIIYGPEFVDGLTSVAFEKLINQIYSE